jgi:hypothetical protein
MIAIETALNGNIFAQGSDFGLLGGVLQAFTFSLANVGMGGLTGRFVLPQLQHISWWRRLVGAVVIIFAIIISVALNLAVAHFRDAMAAGNETTSPAVLAMHSLIASPLALADLLSWFLFGLGFVFFWLSSYDVFQMSDPYPGYTTQYKRVIAAKEEYTDAVNGIHGSMATIRDRYGRHISDIAKQRDHYAHHVATLYDLIARLTNSYNRHCRDVVAANRRLIEEYRDANRRKRSTPPPAYFSTVEDVVARPIPSYTPPSAIPSVADAAADAVRSIAAAHDESLQSLTTVAELGADADAAK